MSAPGHVDTPLEVVLVAGEQLELSPELPRKKRGGDRPDRPDRPRAGTGKATGTAAGTSAGTARASGTAATSSTSSGTARPVPVGDGEGVVNPFKKKKP